MGNVMIGTETWLALISSLLMIIAWLVARAVNRWDAQLKTLFDKIAEHERRWIEHIHAFHVNGVKK